MTTRELEKKENKNKTGQNIKCCFVGFPTEMLSVP